MQRQGCPAGWESREGGVVCEVGRGGHGPDRCLGREAGRPSDPREGWPPPVEMWDHCTPRAAAGAKPGRPAAATPGEGVSLGGGGARKGSGSRRCQELLCLALIRTGREGPEARVQQLAVLGHRSCKGAGSLEAFGARDEYRPAAIVMCSWLNIFFSLKRRWGVWGGV